MAYKIKSIREKIDEIAKDKTFMLEVCPVENVVGNPRETHSSLPRLFVGRENDKDEIKKVLLYPDSKRNVIVVSIVGIGGLGKTALAQLLLDDEEVKNQFELKLWVCVGENFNKKSILEKILEAVKGSKPENLELESLKYQLFQSINGKKYALVLDDVWDENPRECSDLMDLLAEGVNGSRIIITTRLKSVARIARSDLEYELKGLSDDESWDLFKNFAFIGGEVPSSSFEEIGKEIVGKFNGVPLVIKTIGSLLYSKKSEDEWRSFKDGELSIVTQLEDNDIQPTLRLSYNHLPSHLKHCFAYCRLFPKDYEIPVATLVELWIAQGFIRSSNTTKSLKDIGIQWFKELLWRSFFQEVEEDQFGNMKTCKMHDLMHDLAISVAGGEITSSKSNGLYVGKETRHVSIDFKLSFTRQDLLSLCNACNARTFLLVNKNNFSDDEMIGEEALLLIFSKLKCLRALDLHNEGIQTVPRSIYKLELLSYLDLSYNIMVKKLPNSISRLPNLQVLKVDYCSFQELPKDIRKLVKLRCLSMEYCHELTHMPRGIGQLTSLETLSIFVVDKKGRGAELSELVQLKNLRGSLCVSNLRYVKNLKAEFQAFNLKEWQYIQKLKLLWNSFPVEEDGNVEFAAKDIENDEMALDVLQPHQNLKSLQLCSYKGAKFPSWLSSQTTLVKLTLFHCKNIQSLSPFDQFPSLKELRLKGLTNLEYMEIGISCNNGGLRFFFPSLKDLSLEECPNLKGWVRCSETESSSTSVFPSFHCLSSLTIYCCPNLNSVPPFPSIERLDFMGESMKQVEQLLKSNISVTEHYSFSPLSQLKEMSIWNIEEGAIFAGELQQKLTSLTKLQIQGCPGILEMESPPFDLRGLRDLVIRFNEMESFPKWLMHLSSLNKLMFQDCPNLASLPVWMSELTSLQFLYLGDCPKLTERCKNMDGKDWPKIAHIPSIMIDRLMVQENGVRNLINSQASNNSS